MMYQPVKPFHVNQFFGGNGICISNDQYNRIIDCDGTKPPSGFRSLYGPEGHKGLDLKIWRGQEVYCARDGVVVYIDTDTRTGLDVRVESNIGGKKYTHIYEHLLGYAPQVGSKIMTGQLIGWADNTGYSSGDHLHFEVRDEFGNSIDPLSIMYPTFAKDILLFSHKVKWLTEQVALLADRIGAFLREKSLPKK